MTTVEELIALLFEKDHSNAYRAMLFLEEDSETNGAGYPYFQSFITLMRDKQSYRRVRGLRLLAAYAKWDTDLQLDEIIEELLDHIEDEKPTCARQCIQSLPLIIEAKPDFVPIIEARLQHASCRKYKDTLQPLIQKDIQHVLDMVEEKDPVYE